MKTRLPRRSVHLWLVFVPLAEFCQYDWVEIKERERNKKENWLQKVSKYWTLRPYVQAIYKIRGGILISRKHINRRLFQCWKNILYSLVFFSFFCKELISRESNFAGFSFAQVVNGIAEINYNFTCRVVGLERWRNHFKFPTYKLFKLLF